MDPAVMLNLIRAELERLQLHSVNLSVESQSDRLVALQGSLLAYWKLPDRLSARWLLEQLRVLPDGAGPVVVMQALLADLPGSQGGTQLMLFETSDALAAAATGARKDH
jgi:hypothetical protein